MTSIQDLNNLYFFAKVVDFGSYTAAAKALGLQTSKLSRRIAALETELGVRLINRTTRRLSLTEAGKTFHRHCLALLDEAQAAKDAMNQILASPQGLVRISCPTGLSQGGVADVLARFLAKHPRVRVALDATNRLSHRTGGRLVGPTIRSEFEHPSPSPPPPTRDEMLQLPCEIWQEPPTATC